MINPSEVRLLTFLVSVYAEVEPYFEVKMGLITVMLSIMLTLAQTLKLVWFRKTLTYLEEKTT